jgi:hypothetical protein
LHLENKELLLKIQQYESNPTISDSKLKSQCNSSNNYISSDLIIINQKLRKQVENLKLELQELSNAHEELRKQSMKEIIKLKSIITDQNFLQLETSMNTGISGSNKTDKTSKKSRHINKSEKIPDSFRSSNTTEIDYLKKQVAILQRELRLERSSNSILSQRSPSLPNLRQPTREHPYGQVNHRYPSTSSMGSRKPSPIYQRPSNSRPVPSSYRSSVPNDEFRNPNGSKTRVVPRSRSISPSFAPRGLFYQVIDFDE